jgi:CRP/FNR family cyclic AMP-dependent transcriptional regulator
LPGVSPPRREGVRLLQVDPELGEDLSQEELKLATRTVVAEVRRYPKGSWRVRDGEFDPVGSLGLLVLDGLLAREVTVGAYTCAEVLGPGDVLMPWLRVGPENSVATEVEWEVARAMQLAVLDRRFTARISRWPEISGTISRRVMQRLHWLSFHLAVCGLRRVDDRLLLVLWHFADRWGKVTREGVVIDIPLTHRLLAAAIGARRPSVSVSVGRLEEDGLLRRLPRSRWLLMGEAPAELREVQEKASAGRHPRDASDGGEGLAARHAGSAAVAVRR